MKASEANELFGGANDTFLMKLVTQGQAKGVEALLMNNCRGDDNSKISQKGLAVALFEAAAKGKRVIADTILEFSGDVKIDRDARLIYEAGRGNIEEVERLADLGADARGAKSLALVMAIYHNQIHVAMELCRRGADIWEAVQGQGVTAMEKIAAGGPAYENMRNFVRKTLRATKPPEGVVCEMPQI